MSKRLTDEELLVIRERVEKAMEGLWRIGKQSPNGLNNVGTMGGLLIAQTTDESNAVFIAHARQDIPKLLAEIERIQEGKDKYVVELESEVFRLQDELAGDGVWTLSEQLSHARAENERLYNKASEFASIALWCARRLATRQYAEYAYDEIEKVYGYEVDRDWRGEQV